MPPHLPPPPPCRNGYSPALAYNQQGPYSTFCTYGGRSFSILDANTGSLVYESGVSACWARALSYLHATARLVTGVCISNMSPLV